MKIATVVLCILLPATVIAKTGHNAQQQKLKNAYKTISEVKKEEVATAPAQAPKTPQTASTKPTVQVKPIPTGNCFEAMKKYFPASQWQIAQAVIRAESGGRPDADESPTHDYGCFQIHYGLQNYGQQIFNADFNAKIAYGMWLNRGWQPWSAYNNGSYTKYL